MRLEQLFDGTENAERPADPFRSLKFIAHAPNFVKLYTRLFGDKRVPLFPKALLVAAAIYAISPWDLIPMIPFIDAIDDIAVIALALRAFIPLCPRNVVEEHVQLIDEGK